MKVTQEKLPASQIGLEIEIPSEMSKQAYEKALKELTRFADIPGFRKGKVPRQVLIQRFGSLRIKATAVEELIQDGIKKALDQEKIEAIGTPQLRSSFDELVVQFEPGSALTFSAAVDVSPEVTLSQYKGLEAKAEEVKYDPEQVDKVLEGYRKRSSTLVPVERPAEANDMATVDFAGRLAEAVEGETEPAEIPGGSAQDFEIELVEGGFIPGFIEGIVGMALGETKEIAVTFPDPYAQEDLAGKPAVFTITLKDLKARELPELDDDFAQDVSEFETLAELRESLEKRYQDEADAKTKSNKQEALLNELVKYLAADLPETLVKQEVDYSITQTAMRLSQQGMDIRKTFTDQIVSMLREQARPEAILRLQRTLALGEVVKQESIQVTPEEVTTKVNEVMAEMASQPEADRQDIDADRLRQAIEDDLLRDKILDWLEAEATIELVPEGSLKPAADDTTDELAIDEVLEFDAAEATLDVSAEAVVEVSTEAIEAVEAEAVEAEAEVVDSTLSSEDIPSEKSKGTSAKM